MRLYEGMFLVDPALTSDWPAAEAEINRVLDRAEAKVIGVKNWDERKLAYPINRHKRGLYVLSYFEAEPEKIPGIERDVRLSEKLLRTLLIRREKMGMEEVEKSLAAEPPRPPSRYEDRAGRWEDRGPRRGPPRPPREGPPPATNSAGEEKSAPTKDPVETADQQETKE